MARRIITGDPGETYTNDGDRFLYQLKVDWSNSCGLCCQFDGQIGPPWPIPYHRNCRCRNIPIPPGATSAPFVDYRAKIRTVSRSQQAAIMGRANLTLVERGVVAWDDVVTTGRVRSLREVVSRNKLTVAGMVAAGVGRSDAAEAFDAVHSGTQTRSEVARQQAVDQLLSQGHTPAAIRDTARKALAARLTLDRGNPPPGTAPAVPIAPRPAPGSPGGSAVVITPSPAFARLVGRLLESAIRVFRDLRIPIEKEAP